MLMEIKVLLTSALFYLTTFFRLRNMGISLKYQKTSYNIEMHVRISQMMNCEQLIIHIQMLYSLEQIIVL